MSKRRAAGLIGSALAKGAAAIALVLSGIAGAGETHDPVEYFSRWSGYSHPIHLRRKISEEQAQALAAAGNAHVIGYFDAGGKLTRVVKMLRGAVFFEFTYSYHPNGKLAQARITDADGRVSVLDYDERGR
jgi:hypothetical protein